MSDILRNRRGEVKLNASRLAGYATAASAAAVAGTAEGAITYSGPVNITLSDVTLDGNATAANLVFGTHNLTLAHGIGTTNAASGYAFTVGAGLATPGVDVGGFTAGAFNYVINVPAGAPISAIPTFLGPTIAGTMAFNVGYTSSQFLTVGDAFIGVRFNTNQYGWVRVHMDSGTPLNSFTIVDFAYADAGEAINAGQVPTPGALGALALGGAGLLGWRRRKIA